MSFAKARLGSLTQQVRHASKGRVAVSEKIQVQLLKDYGPLGFAGEIVRVRPAFMRNFLHVDNKACYITKDHGPRIPVVEKQKIVEVKKTEELPVEEEEETTGTTAMSLEELSNLFSTMKSSKKKTQAQGSASFDFNPEASEEATFTLLELEEGLPSVFNITSGQTVSFPITKEALAEVVFKSTGIQVPTTAIRVTGSDKAVLAEITKPGEYQWLFEAPGSAPLKRTLRIH